MSFLFEKLLGKAMIETKNNVEALVKAVDFLQSHIRDSYTNITDPDELAELFVIDNFDKVYRGLHFDEDSYNNFHKYPFLYTGDSTTTDYFVAERFAQDDFDENDNRPVILSVENVLGIDVDKSIDVLMDNFIALEQEYKVNNQEITYELANVPNVLKEIGRICADEHEIILVRYDEHSLKTIN